MTLSNAQAHVGLITDAWPASSGVTGPVQVGRLPERLSLSDATVAYVCTYSAITSAKTGTLVVKTGATTVTGGAAVADGDGLDFEGVAIPTMGTILGIRARRTDSNGGEVTLTGSSSALLMRLPANGHAIMAATAGLGTTVRDTTITIANSTTAAATIEITVIGKV
jgi:hypothetical protein